MIMLGSARDDAFGKLEKTPAPIRRLRGTRYMRAKTIFILNAVITGGYAIAFLVAAGPLLAVYGIAPSHEGTYMARWFGVGLLANGLSDLAGPGCRRVRCRPSHRPGSGHCLRRRCGAGNTGSALRPVQRAGLDRGRVQPAAWRGLRLPRIQAASHPCSHPTSGRRYRNFRFPAAASRMTRCARGDSRVPRAARRPSGRPTLSRPVASLLPRRGDDSRSARRGPCPFSVPQ